MANQIKSMKKELSSVLNDARVMAFIQVVRRHGDATLGDVFELAKEMGIENLNVNDVFFGDLPSTGKSWAKNVKALPAVKKVAPAKESSELDTRTLKGRKKYDKTVFRALSKRGWRKAPDVREKVGGTPGQVRSSLARLIQSGSVEWEGRARATKYRKAS